MIDYLEGKIIASDDESVVLLTDSGVGFKVFLPAANLSKIANSKGKIKLHTTLEVREDKFFLYGFLKAEARDFFEFLTSVSGIGPSTGLAILDLGSLKDIKKAIENQDQAFFAQAPGIGTKKARKLIFELKTRVSDYDLKKDTLSKEFKQAVEALQSMGYKKSHAYSALKGIYKPGKKVETMVKQALKEMGS